ncbi:SDR family NAD(P)-dependent oxidoreductase [Chloroflexota bacterium]
MKLEGKVAIVTGAGRGIGRVITLTLAGKGAKVVINDIHQQVADAVANEVRGLGGESLSIVADVTVLEQVDTMVKKVLAEFGRVDILVNNAGLAWTEEGPVYFPGLFAESKPEEWERTLNITLRSTLNCTRTVLAHMIRQRSGKIVNISTMAADLPTSGVTIYAAGKAGVNAFTKTLAAEVGKFGINVNAVSPGFIKTSGYLSMEAKREINPEEYQNFIEREKATLSICPLGRRGDPEDVANAVAFLASDAASYITGCILPVYAGTPSIVPR